MSPGWCFFQGRDLCQRRSVRLELADLVIRLILVFANLNVRPVFDFGLITTVGIAVANNSSLIDQGVALGTLDLVVLIN